MKKIVCLLCLALAMAASGACALLLALARDACIAQGQIGWGVALLAATLMMLALCVVLLSCRFFVDEQGVGVGILLSVRRTPWHELGALGVLRCNSRRRYLYGMYGVNGDFLNLLHHAPRCGAWGFVAPMTGRLEAAVEMYCPYKVCLRGQGVPMRTKRQRPLWQYALLNALLMLLPALVVFAMAAQAMLRAVHTAHAVTAWGLAAAAVALSLAGALLLARVRVCLTTCPCISEEGVSAGRGLYLPWSEVRFCYGRRTAEGSGLFMLSQPLEAVSRHGCPPLMCLSLPDTSTLLLAYLTYCPYAKKHL